jgi:hypothetical protein
MFVDTTTTTAVCCTVTKSTLAGEFASHRIVEMSAATKGIINYVVIVF